MKGLAVALIVSIVAISHAFKIQPKILNGIKTDPSDFSFHVFINFLRSHTCGGSIIGDRWILTAAHCFMSNTTADVLLGWGEIGHFSEIIPVGTENFYPHPDFEQGSPLNDIGLMKLPHRLKLGGDVQAAKLPNDCRPMHRGNIAAIVLGTGQYTIENSEINFHFALRRMELVTTPTAECETIFGLLDTDHRLICANVTNRRSIYHGDSGGPMINADDGTLIGIADMVNLLRDESETDPQKKCLAQAFSNVRYHFKWIAQITGMALPEC